MRILKLWLPVIAWAGLILFTATDAFSAETTGSLLQRILGPNVPPWLHIALRKLMHLLGYGMLAGLTWRADRRWMVILTIVLAVAVTDESLQSRTARRTGSPWDVGVDLVGGAIAVAAIESQSRRVSKSQRGERAGSRDL